MALSGPSSSPLRVFGIDDSLNSNGASAPANALASLAIRLIGSGLSVRASRYTGLVETIDQNGGPRRLGLTSNRVLRFRRKDLCRTRVPVKFAGVQQNPPSPSMDTGSGVVSRVPMKPLTSNRRPITWRGSMTTITFRAGRQGIQITWPRQTSCAVTGAGTDGYWRNTCSPAGYWT